MGAPSDPDFALPDDPRRAVAAQCLRCHAIVVPVLLAAIPVIGLFIFLFVAGGREDPAANFQASQAAYQQLHPVLPDDANAANDYRLAEQALVSLKDGISLNRRGDYYDLPAIKAHLERNGVALAQLLAAAEKADCEWGDPYSASLKKLPDIHSLQYLLNVHARRCAHHGDHTQAAAALKAACVLGCRYQKVDWRANSSGTAHESLCAILFWDPPKSSAALDGYSRAVGAEYDGQRQALERLERMRIDALYCLDGLAAGKLSPGQLGWIAQHAARPGSSRMVWYGGERRSFISAMESYRAALAGGEKELSWGRHVREHASAPMPFCSRLDYWPRHSFEIDERHRALVTALAFMRHRIKYGKDPRKLSELVPEFLPAVTVSAFSQTPLALTEDSAGIKLSGDLYDPIDFQHVYGEREVIRITAPGHDSNSPYDDEIVLLPPLWQSIREEKH
jgi:hypothetical protein